MANFTFYCPKCGIQVEAEDGWRGQQANCPGCNEIITIPNKVSLNISQKSKKKFSVKRISILVIIIIIATFFGSILIEATVRAGRKARMIKELAILNQSHLKSCDNTVILCFDGLMMSPYFLDRNIGYIICRRLSIFYIPMGCL